MAGGGGTAVDTPLPPGHAPGARQREFHIGKLVRMFPDGAGSSGRLQEALVKTAKARTAETQKRRTAGRREPAGKTETIPPEARRSTTAALLKHAPGWTGEDLEDVIATVTGTRTKTRF